MLSRRILRIKALQVLYAFFQSDENSFIKAEKDLLHSLNKSYDLLHYLLLLIIDVKYFAEKKIEQGLEKNLPTYQDLNPNKRFINNRVIEQIENNGQLKTYLNDNKLSWDNHPELIKTLYNQMIESDQYISYMNHKDDLYKIDSEFVSDFYSYIIPESQEISAILEEQSLFWNDELEFILSIIVNLIKKFRETNNDKLKFPPMIKEEDDLVFVKTLVRKTITDRTLNMSIIEKHAKNWEVDRIAFMDILIMMMAISEAIHFPEIPTKVTINEYLEISKFYSTEKSSTFINGILDHAFIDLKSEKKIVKRGSGLIGE